MGLYSDLKEYIEDHPQYSIDCQFCMTEIHGWTHREVLNKCMDAGWTCVLNVGPRCNECTEARRGDDQ